MKSFFCMKTMHSSDDYLEGYKDGLRAFAHWKDGVQYVGTCGTTLQQALDQADKDWHSEMGETR